MTLLLASVEAEAQKFFSLQSSRQTWISKAGFVPKQVVYLQDIPSQ